MMRALSFILLLFFFVVSLCSCNTEQVSAPESLDSSDVVQSAQPESDTVVTEESEVDYQERITSLTYANAGRMGDTDGPAFAVYSNIGYSGASVELDLKNAEIQNTMRYGKYLNGYSFLGIDVYQDGYWANCVDAGLCWAGNSGGWHLFYNIFEPLNYGTPTWYESRVILPDDDVYTLAIFITADNYATVMVEGKTNGFSDSRTFEVKGAKADGSNTAMLFNSALDFPPNTKVDSNGNPSENWVDITLANSDKGVYLRNLVASNLTLYKSDIPRPWTNDYISSLSIWPDMGVSGFDYSPTTVTLFDGTRYVIDLDMNRK